MADLSSITLPNGNSYNFKDTVARSTFLRNAPALLTNTYTSVIASGDATKAADTNLFCIKILPTSYNTTWKIMYRVTATMAGVTEANGSGFQESYVYVEGMRDTYATYFVWNDIRNTSYRPYYYNVLYRAKTAGITNNYGHVMGVGLRSAYNPTTAANARTFTFDILDYADCTVSFLDSMLVYASIPGTGSTNYSGQTEFNGSTQGFTRSGTDANNYDRLVMPSVRLYAGTNKVFPYSICMEDSSGNIQSLTMSSGTGTSKSRNTTGFKLGNIFYQAYNETIASGSLVRASNLYLAFPLDFRYSTNCGTTLTQYAPVYLVGTISSSDGLFYLDTTWWTHTLPSTDDGKLYIFLGYTYSTYQVWLVPEHKIYCYKNGSIQEYNPGMTPTATSATLASKATQLETSRTIQTDLTSTSSASFDGTANITPGITGTLPIANGGTGATTAAGVKTNLSLDNVENKSSATIRSEITSTNVVTALGYTPANITYDSSLESLNIVV